MDTNTNQAVINTPAMHVSKSQDDLSKLPWASGLRGLDAYFEGWMWQNTPRLTVNFHFSNMLSNYLYFVRALPPCTKAYSAQGFFCLISA